MDKNLQQKLWKTSFALLILLIIALGGMLMWQYVLLDNKVVAQQTWETLNRTYFDSEQTIINGDISVETINELVEYANQLKSIKYRGLKQKASQAVDQYKELALVNQLVDEIPNEVMASAQWEALNLKSTMNIEQLMQLKQQRSYGAQDAFFNQMNQVWDYYETRLNRQSMIETQLANLPMDVTASLIDTLSVQLMELETEIEQLGHSEVQKQWREQLQEKVSQLAEMVQRLNEEEPLSRSQCQALFQSKQFATQLSGTELDPRLLVALTFDDGPHPDITPQVLDILNEYQIKGTFFVTGANVDKYPELAKRIVDEGHYIGNHTYNHPDLSKSSDEEVIQQLEWTQESIIDATGATPFMFRMPFGAGGKRVVHLAQALELTSVIWNVDTEDWRSHDKDAICEQVKTYLQEKTLMLMHDTHQAAPDALRILIPDLITQGYEFVDPLSLGYDNRFFE
ncbi:polysaccharide deacetylase family protein [Aerococcaceae bacterium zg-ZJ1578]|uniref:polysaccharide deacetylase family protein n=1 Tax=Aerococcaceae bacterium zg-252 TaxID=2796928 RepID=UPI001A342F81|nr:polysaccharide deacetylase family protein [Aerococcaceae bacterium zg-1578]